MNSLEALKTAYRAGSVNSTILQNRLGGLVDGSVTFESTYVPVNQSLEVLFSSRAGTDELISLYSSEITILNLTAVSDPDGIVNGNGVNGNGVLHYHRAQRGSFLGGEQVTWQTVTKLTFGSDGKITDILLQVLDWQSIDTAYPAST
jgi:hypothetical protein